MVEGNIYRVVFDNDEQLIGVCLKVEGDSIKMFMPGRGDYSFGTSMVKSFVLVDDIDEEVKSGIDKLCSLECAISSFEDSLSVLKEERSSLKDNLNNTLGILTYADFLDVLEEYCKGGKLKEMRNKGYRFVYLGGTVGVVRYSVVLDGKDFRDLLPSLPFIYKGFDSELFLVDDYLSYPDVLKFFNECRVDLPWLGNIVESLGLSCNSTLVYTGMYRLPICGLPTRETAKAIADKWFL